MLNLKYFLVHVSLCRFSNFHRPADTTSSGILLYMSQFETSVAGDFFLMAVDQGRVVVRFNLGAGVVEMMHPDVLPPDTTYTARVYRQGLQGKCVLQ